MYKFLTFLISLIPINFIKIYLLKLIGLNIESNCEFGYFIIISNKNIELVNSKIESFNIIFANNIKIIDSKIKIGNLFKNISKFELISSTIGSFNKFVTDKRHKKKNNS